MFDLNFFQFYSSISKKKKLAFFFLIFKFKLIERRAKFNHIFIDFFDLIVFSKFKNQKNNQMVKMYFIADIYLKTMVSLKILNLFA